MCLKVSIILLSQNWRDRVSRFKSGKQMCKKCWVEYNKDYSEEDIYNADKTGLFYNMKNNISTVGWITPNNFSMLYYRAKICEINLFGSVLKKWDTDPTWSIWLFQCRWQSICKQLNFAFTIFSTYFSL